MGPCGEEKCQDKNTPTSGAKTKTQELEFNTLFKAVCSLTAQACEAHREALFPGQQGALEGPLK